MFENTKTFVVKVTKSCNLRCKYCYVKDKDKNENIFMTFETFKDLIDKIIEDKKRSWSQEFNPVPTEIIFHGGEPSLLGYENYKKFLSYAYRRFREEKLQLQLSMQTNATFINDDHKNLINLFKMYDVHLGYSFDGLYDSEKSRGVSAERWKSFFKYLEENEISKSFLMVVNKFNYKHFLKNLKFLKKNNIESIKVNYVIDVTNVGGLEITGQEYFENIIKPYLDEFIKNPRKYPAEVNILEILSNYFNRYILKDFTRGNRTGNCYIKFCGAGNKIVEINPDGSVDRCGRYCQKSEYSLCAESFNQRDFLSLDFIRKQIELFIEKHKSVIRNQCDLCEAADICDYGCMAFQKEKTGEWGIAESVCDLFKPTIDYIMDHEAELFKSWCILKMSDKGECFINLGRIIKNSRFLSEYGRLVDLIHRSGLKWTYDRNFEYEGEVGTHSKFLIIKR